MPVYTTHVIDDPQLREEVADMMAQSPRVRRGVHAAHVAGNHASALPAVSAGTPLVTNASNTQRLPSLSPSHSSTGSSAHRTQVSSGVHSTGFEPGPALRTPVLSSRSATSNPRSLSSLTDMSISSDSHPNSAIRSLNDRMDTMSLNCAASASGPTGNETPSFRSPNMLPPEAARPPENALLPRGLSGNIDLSTRPAMSIHGQRLGAKLPQAPARIDRFSRNYNPVGMATINQDANAPRGAHPATNTGNPQAGANSASHWNGVPASQVRGPNVASARRAAPHNAAGPLKEEPVQNRPMLRRILSQNPDADLAECPLCGYFLSQTDMETHMKSCRRSNRRFAP
ncbi:hypothetical protein CERSUDRAFT_111461 [Gelatoporia subvermispora B]|uniref:Uncharacterized protein n=1 Tax=Ceriporiopsis subvermispora (strain B) TaxID=914234 RepID=M2QUX5_CERS8|nr:hypothetical protein CERSUDRAFT_111461 [Gelatoporia subvermispora B]